jgi:hypothetical protein
MTTTESTAMTTTMTELWSQGWVAGNEEQASHQAFRMFDLFNGREVEVDRLDFPWGEWHDHYGWCEERLLIEPYPLVIPYDCEPNEWDGEVLYAMWSVRPAKPGQIIIFEERVRKGGEWETVTKRVSLDYLVNRRWAWPIRTTAPGIGTADGFGHKDGLVLPEPCEIKESGYCSTHMTTGCKPDIEKEA